MKDAITVLEVLIAMPLITFAAVLCWPWVREIYLRIDKAAKRWGGKG